MATSTTTRLFPLPEDQLPREQVDPETVQGWKSEALCAISTVMADTSSWFYRFGDADQEFARAYDKNDTRGCMRVLSGAANVVEYLSQSELHMTLDDVVYAMYCDTTQQQRAVHAQLYQDICLDTAILELYERATTEDPFHRVALLWITMCPKLSNASLGWSLSSARDYVDFDLSCTTTDAEGRPVLINYPKSQDLALARDDNA